MRLRCWQSLPLLAQILSACLRRFPDLEQEFRQRLEASAYPMPVFAGTLVGLEYPGGDKTRVAIQRVTVAVSRIWKGGDQALKQITLRGGLELDEVIGQ